MKNIFIAGVAKSGKSTLAKALNKDFKYNHIPLDYFASSLKYNFPSTNITSNVVINKESSKNLSKLLSRVITIMNSNEEEKFIIDSAHIMPFDIIEYLDKDRWDIYYIGYPNITAKEKLKLIRKYEQSNDWTCKRDDTELLDILEQLIKISIEIKNDCDKLGIKFIDTSMDIDNIFNIY